MCVCVGGGSGAGYKLFYRGKGRGLYKTFPVRLVECVCMWGGGGVDYFVTLMKMHSHHHFPSLF